MKIASPIVIDLGRARAKDVGDLLQGAGNLLEELEEVMRLVQLNANWNNGETRLVPVVAVYRPRSAS
jgi:hypothetical protein